MAYTTGFICLLLLILPAAKAAHHVQTGTDKPFCGFKCHQPRGILQLRRRPTTLLAAECLHWAPKIRHWGDQRFFLNRSNGCWTLRHAQNNDTGSYQIRYYGGSGERILESIEIIVLDAVRIQNISCNCSLLGSDVSLDVVFSGGGDVSVLWEVDGSSLPSRFSLKNDNRTLIIENVSKEDTKRKFSVRVKNPVSEDKREYYLVIPDKRNQYHRTHVTTFIYTSFSFVILIISGMLYGIVKALQVNPHIQNI